MKHCSKCKKLKSFEDYSKDKQHTDGLRSDCKSCHNIYLQSYYQKNKEKLIVNNSKWVKNNREHKTQVAKKWKQNNKDKVTLSGAIYYQKNKEKINKINDQWWSKNPTQSKMADARRRSAKLNAIPKWVDLNKIKEFYDTAQGLNMLLGEWHHVDHIVPLRHPLVCGLHCETNLQVLTAKENCIKGNRWWPNMPENNL